MNIKHIIAEAQEQIKLFTDGMTTQEELESRLILLLADAYMAGHEHGLDSHKINKES